MDPKKQLDRKNSDNLELAEELVPDGSLRQTSMRHARRHFKMKQQENPKPSNTENGKSRKDIP